MKILKFLTILGLIINLIATIFLFLGSKSLPVGMQSWSGQSESDLKFYKERKIYTKIGLILLIIGFSLQLIGAFK